MKTQTTYHIQTVNDVEVFYREAGAVNAPLLLMLHGRRDPQVQEIKLILEVHATRMSLNGCPEQG